MSNSSRQSGLSATTSTVRAMTTGTVEHACTDRYELTERDREILEFERGWWKYSGARESAIREKFDISSTRYFQLLNWLIDQPAALEADPVTVHRILRLRTARQAQRSARRSLG